MTSFKGFPDGKNQFTSIPAKFFDELLPEIDHLAELKVVLYAFWCIEHMEGNFRYLERKDFSADQRFMKGLASRPQAAETALQEALERATGRGIFLSVVFASEGEERTYYFLNSAKGRAAVEAIKKGKWRPSGVLRSVVSLGSERPNIFRLYEENIGPLTPILADTLKDAQDTYPEPWIYEAVQIAVENNKRNWKYVEAILRRWQEGGKDEQNRRDSEEDRRRYAEWESPDR
jgi:DNA replication protein